MRDATFLCALLTPLLLMLLRRLVAAADARAARERHAICLRAAYKRDEISRGIRARCQEMLMPRADAIIDDDIGRFAACALPC